MKDINSTNKKTNIKQLKKNKKDNPQNINKFKLTDTQEDFIFNKKKFIKIDYYNKEEDIKTTYTYISETKNFIFYNCNVRKKCNGKGKINKNTKEFIITELCNKDIEHNNISYEQFVEEYEKNEGTVTNLNFSKRKNQKYYVYYSIIKNNDIDNATIRKNFYDKTKISLGLNVFDISKIRNKIIGKFKNLNLDDLITKIKCNNLEIDKYIFDIKYNIKIKNKDIERKQKIIIIGIKDNFNYLNEKETNEFFLDSTFKIIPRNLRPYKLLILSGIPKKIKTPIMLIFVFIKYLDNISYNKLFNYLNENFKFKPDIIHSDYEKALHLGIKENKYTQNALNIKCFFHYTQMIRKNFHLVEYVNKN